MWQGSPASFYKRRGTVEEQDVEEKKDGGAHEISVNHDRLKDVGLVA